MSLIDGLFQLFIPHEMQRNDEEFTQAKNQVPGASPWPCPC